MSKSDLCYCGYKIYKHGSSEFPYCAIHFASSESLKYPKHNKEDRQRLEQAIVEQIQARIRDD